MSGFLKFFLKRYIYSSNEYDFENQDTEESRIFKKGMTDRRIYSESCDSNGIIVDFVEMELCVLQTKRE